MPQPAVRNLRPSSYFVIWLLEISEPDVVAALLQACEPAAQSIKRKHHEEMCLPSPEREKRFHY